MTASAALRWGRVAALLVGAGFGPATLLHAADAVPAWLSAAAAAALPGYGSRVPAVVLLDEERLTVQADGRFLHSTRGAVRVLHKEGRRHALAQAVYVLDSGSVRSMRAWLVRADGSVKSYRGSDIVDAAAAEGDVYNEVRRRFISGVGDADSGSVFGWEIETEERPLFPQVEWFFQGELPVLCSRLQLALAPGWRADALTFNHEPVVPSTAAGVSTWELRDLPFLEPEPARPGLGRLAPRLALTLTPPPGERSVESFSSWPEVAAWLSRLHEPQAVVSGPVLAKARELTRSAASDGERIRAVARFCQRLSYVSVQTGMGRGGGYRPHAADSVLTKGYGDCKDKANLMRALLAALGIESHPVAVYSSDRDHVREEWPSAQQFDHCILAVRVAEAAPASAVLRHPALGPLLIFDPTSVATALGDLPRDEQGSWGLLVHPRSGGLVRLPELDPEANLLERTVQATLDGTGKLAASVREVARGQSAARRRSDWVRRSAADYAELIQGWVAQGAPGASVSAAQPAEDDSGLFRLSVDFEAARYAQLMQDRLMVFRPAVLPLREALSLTEPQRRYPIVLTPVSFAESASFSLPAGFAVDELPQPVELREPFGEYSATGEAGANGVLVRRRLLVRAATLSPEDYARVRRFFETVRAAERAPVVLVRR